MIKHNNLQTSSNQQPESAGTIARRAEDVAREIADRATIAFREAAESTKDAAGDASKSAMDLDHTIARKTGETFATSREYVRRNPLPVALGALAIGAVVGYILVKVGRKPTFRERYADEPLDAMRKAIIGALSPVTQSIHKGYDSARDGAGKALHEAQNFKSKRAIHSFAERIERIGDNLKFW